MKFGVFVESALNKMDREIKNLIKDLNKLKNNKGLIGNVNFNFEEQELIRRVFKSIFKQLESFRDVETAKEILKKTEWIDGN